MGSNKDSVVELNGESYVHVPFNKIHRYSRDIVITEKIDGTNGVILVAGNQIAAGSKKRWITQDAVDNFGFRNWVMDNKDELIEGLGDGIHYGEWWGSGIQRGYGFKNGERFFSLFNVNKWDTTNTPACCRTVPVLYRGVMSECAIRFTLWLLKACGSVAALGYDRPEGVVIFHEPSGFLLKKTIEGDDKPKWKNEEV